MTVRFTNNKNVRVPWLELAKTPTKFLDADTIPDGFNLSDPSKLTNAKVNNLWNHWSERARNGKPILIFIYARKQDTRRNARREQDERTKVNGKRTTYVEPESDGGDDNHEGISGSPNGPPPPKRLRFTDWPSVPEKLSPATADLSDQRKFLSSLSEAREYTFFLSRVYSLPDLVSYYLFLRLFGFV